MFEKSFRKLFEWSHDKDYIKIMFDETVSFFNNFLQDKNLDTIFVKNKQHSILPDQQKQLENYNYATLEVPAKGWNIEEMKAIGAAVWYVLSCHENAPENGKIIFLSPVPFLILNVTWRARAALNLYDVLLFHNDNRNKKELDNGKVIYTVAKEGWQLVGLDDIL